MNSTPILIQPDIVTLSPYRKFRSFVHRRCNRVGVWHLLSCAADAPQSKRASEREPGPENFDRVEGEFRIEAALNVAGLPEAMLLAREQEIANRIAFAP